MNSLTKNQTVISRSNHGALFYRQQVDTSTIMSSESFIRRSG